MVGLLEQVFPGLHGSGYQVTSPQADRYNCIAWAAGDTSNWWWPDEPGQPDSSYWPTGVPRRLWEALLNAELAALSAVPSKGLEEIPEQWLVLAKCRNEKEQVEKLGRFQREGLECKALVGSSARWAPWVQIGRPIPRVSVK